jgi:hypothetical protein
MPIYFVAMFWPYVAFASMWGKPRPKLYLVQNDREEG